MDERVKFIRDCTREKALRKDREIVKCVYDEHPRVATMSSEEAEKIREEMGVIVASDCISPKVPIRVRQRRSKGSSVNTSSKPNSRRYTAVSVPNPILTFEQAALPESFTDVLKGSFVKPTVVQSVMWPIVLNGHDVLCNMGTGSGKTLAHVLPCLIHVLSQPSIMSPNTPLALILAPTQELVQQIAKVCCRFARLVNLTVLVLFGGPRGEQQRQKTLKTVVHVVVSSPHFLHKIMKRVLPFYHMNVSQVSFLVLDEVSLLMTPLFKPVVDEIIDSVNPERQLIAVDSSLSFPKVFARHYMVSAFKTRPYIVTNTEGLIPPKTVSQNFFFLKGEEEKLSMCSVLLSNWKQGSRCFIFVDNAPTLVLVYKLVTEKYSAKYRPQCISGFLDSSERYNALEAFRSSKCNCIISTHLLMWGIDVPNVENVLNFNCPRTYTTYILTAGRTARAGCKGTVTTFIFESDLETCSSFFLNVLKGLKNDYTCDKLHEFVLEAKKKYKKPLKSDALDAKGDTPCSIELAELSKE